MCALFLVVSLDFMIHSTFLAFIKRRWLIACTSSLPCKAIIFYYLNCAICIFERIIKPRCTISKSITLLYFILCMLAKPMLSAQLARFGRNYAIRMLLWPFAFEWRVGRLIFLRRSQFTLRAHEKRASRAALTQWDKCAHLRRRVHQFYCLSVHKHNTLHAHRGEQLERRVAEPGKCLLQCCWFISTDLNCTFQNRST